MPTDWHITHAHPGTGPSEQGGYPQRVAITTEEGESVDVWGPQAQAQAALIVRAVNAHDALVARVAQLEAALKDLVAYYQPRDTSGIWVQAQVALRAAQTDASTP